MNVAPGGVVRDRPQCLRKNSGGAIALRLLVARASLQAGRE